MHPGPSGVPTPSGRFHRSESPSRVACFEGASCGTALAVGALRREIAMKNDRTVPTGWSQRIVVGLMSVIAVTLGAGEIPMSLASPSNGVKNVVLVHGGFVDGSGWEGVYKALKRDG